MSKRFTFCLLIITVCFSFLSGCGKNESPPVIEIAASTPCQINSGGTTSFSVTGSYPADAEVHWEASLGTFANPSAIASSYTAPQVSEDTDVTIAVNVIDGDNAYPRTLICKIIAPTLASPPTPEPAPIEAEEEPVEDTEGSVEQPEEPVAEPEEPTEEPTVEPTEEPTAANPWVGISFPTTGGTVGININVQGTYSNLPTGNTIWVASMPHSNGLYYFQNGPATLSGGTWRNEAWIGSDAPSESGQAFDIIVYIANQSAATHISGLLAQWKAANNYPGIDYIPAGMTEYHRVTVARQ
ncbi:MAG: hypothetical protein JXJ17_17435 [Anaerolineae bacterium]|nr:hypothetical protein [Anaerolineae bacterium]